VIYNAGMNVHEDCAIGGLTGGLTGVTNAVLAECTVSGSGRRCAAPSSPRPLSAEE